MGMMVSADPGGERVVTYFGCLTGGCAGYSSPASILQCADATYMKIKTFIA